jgi:hypothetical protein
MSKIRSRSAAPRQFYLSNGVRSGSKHPERNEQEKAGIGKMQFLQRAESFRTCKKLRRSAHRRGLSGILS